MLIKDLYLDYEVIDCKKKLCKIVKRAKKSYFQGIINNLDSHNIFQDTKQFQSITKYSNSPIWQANKTLAVTNL